MYFWANSQCRIENSVEKAAVFLHPLNIIGLKIVPREYKCVSLSSLVQEFSRIIYYRSEIH